MADTFHFELVSPDRLLFSGEVTQVDAPGSEGDFGVLAGHAPLVAMLRPGILKVIEGGKEERIVVFGGFAEVSPAGMTVLADEAVRTSDLDTAKLASAIKDAEEDAADTKDDAQRDRLRRRIGQLQAVQAAMSGGSSAAH
ncbi:ATP synthase epsilon chain [Variibacter gotjawalensis]|jgi:F-type H+-transporting ATPase subunit epsilon|uniref:ATP synthase epsilon chain n=1 Tax=Variibacter gotjawalensis TaxID=1333996 RepID=A0A0S3PRX7_9BRAD|nr:F0F1 ATP synthase subunit epsilon [Variibacter gotjawalensis]NIK48959.1 F-type H+-transporting ATPase subunit epsilon [Variibacter gotjawalensis]RZS50815.1 ATP synthase F1 subcomplex epsilon subunit [Variibacter gotjawalensis]BAT58649.1 ATP synthase epsilon chain [Variibacter gotjawalensis]